MRRIINSKKFVPVQWVPMKYEADCWIAACAMALGQTYERIEKSFGSGAEYSEKVLGIEAENFGFRIMKNILKQVTLVHLCAELGYAPILNSEINFEPVEGRRYLVSVGANDTDKSYMGHAIVIDEMGKVFDPDPKFDPKNPRYSLEKYTDVLGWEIVRL